MHWELVAGPSTATAWVNFFPRVQEHVHRRCPCEHRPCFPFIWLLLGVALVPMICLSWDVGKGRKQASAVSGKYCQTGYCLSLSLSLCLSLSFFMGDERPYDLPGAQPYIYMYIYIYIFLSLSLSSSSLSLSLSLSLSHVHEQVASLRCSESLLISFFASDS